MSGWGGKRESNIRAYHWAANPHCIMPGRAAPVVPAQPAAYFAPPRIQRTIVCVSASFTCGCGGIGT
jgi:hypothetical protein